MNTLKNVRSIGIALLVVASLAACDKPGPAETAGKKLDQSAEDAGKKIAEAADKAGEKMDSQSEKAGLAIADAEITTKVKAAIFAEAGLKTLQISVDTIKGQVTLSGSVNSAENSVKAESLAAAVQGVDKVENRLKITSPQK